MSPSTAIVPGIRETSAAVCSSPFDAHDAMSPTASSVRDGGGAVASAWLARANAQTRASAASLCRGDTGEQHFGNLDRVQRRSLSQVVAGKEEPQAVDRPFVLANPPHEHLV